MRRSDHAAVFLCVAVAVFSLHQITTSHSFCNPIFPVEFTEVTGLPSQRVTLVFDLNVSSHVGTFTLITTCREQHPCLELTNYCFKSNNFVSHFILPLNFPPMCFHAAPYEHLFIWSSVIFRLSQKLNNQFL